MSNELTVLPGRARALTAGEWCDEAAGVIGRLAPVEVPPLEVWFWRKGPAIVARPSDTLEDLVTVRVRGLEGGMERTVGGPLVDEEEDDPEARFVRAHQCPWTWSLFTTRSLALFRLLTAVMAIAAARAFEGAIVNDNHSGVPLEVATGPEWEAWLGRARSAGPPVTDFAGLAEWYSSLSR